MNVPDMSSPRPDPWHPLAFTFPEEAAEAGFCAVNQNTNGTPSGGTAAGTTPGSSRFGDSTSASGGAHRSLP
jgi:hypothetical protein